MTNPADRHDAALVAMVDEALRRGMTWAQIGSATIGRPDAKAAKRHAKHAARRARHAALVAQAGERR